ncbi:MAG: nucleotide-binding protein [Puia sp.]|nr:nucleotide-binding protein [Puia sp.]
MSDSQPQSPTNLKGPYPILEEGTVKALNEKIANIGRPTLFVGSSRESKPIAEKLKQCFPTDHFEVDIWYDGVFGPTRSGAGTMSNMEWLKNFTDIYDYAIFIFVPEDTLVSATRRNLAGNNAIEAHVTRHNVVFEYGMFLGRIGAKKSFILFDEEVKDFIELFFTDLKENLDDTRTSMEIHDDFRIELYPYKGHYEEYVRSGFTIQPYDTDSIEAAIEKIKLTVELNFKDVDIGFLPATTLAFGYYNNFIETFVRNLNLLRTDDPYPEEWYKQELNLEKLDEFRKAIREATTVQLRIVIPTSLEGARQDQFVPHFTKENFLQISFPGKNRSITLLRLKKKAMGESGDLVIYDVPTTLNSSIEAIDMLTPHKDIRKLLKEKEIRNFRKSIAYKLEKGTHTPGTENIGAIVSVISYDVFRQETM